MKSIIVSEKAEETFLGFKMVTFCAIIGSFWFLVAMGMFIADMRLEGLGCLILWRTYIIEHKLLSND
mgnify:CR=1 FL=1